MTFSIRFGLSFGLVLACFGFAYVLVSFSLFWFSPLVDNVIFCFSVLHVFSWLCVGICTCMHCCGGKCVGLFVMYIYRSTGVCIILSTLGLVGVIGVFWAI